MTLRHMPSQSVSKETNQGMTDLDLKNAYSSGYYKARCETLKKALVELLEQIDSLEGVEYTRDTEPYKAEACWDSAVSYARAMANIEDTV